MEMNKFKKYSEEIAKFGGKHIIKLFFATSNKNKFNEMAFLGKNAFEMTQYPLEIPEIQGTIQEIIKAKIETARILSKHFPILVDDTALEIEALKNWPGPYVKEFLDSFKAEGIVELINKIDSTNTKAKAICSVGYLESENSKPIFGFGIVEGVLKLRPDGKYSGFGFDPVFYPDVDEKSFSDLTIEEKGNMSHRAGALLDLCAQLDSQKS